MTLPLPFCVAKMPLTAPLTEPSGVIVMLPPAEVASMPSAPVDDTLPAPAKVMAAVPVEVASTPATTPPVTVLSSCSVPPSAGEIRCQTVRDAELNGSITLDRYGPTLVGERILDDQISAVARFEGALVNDRGCRYR